MFPPHCSLLRIIIKDKNHGTTNKIDLKLISMAHTHKYIVASLCLPSYELKNDNNQSFH